MVFAAQARVLFDDLDNGGFYLDRASGTSIDGMVAGWRTEPGRRRDHAPALWISRSTDVSLRNCRVLNAPGAGFLFDECVRPTLSQVQVMHTGADGIHFANCQDGRVVDAQTDWTGDDGVAFVNYRRKPGNTGGSAQRIKVRNSRSRGITVVGQSNVEISDFEVDTTSCNGIYCAQEESYDTRVPSNVKFSHGTIIRAGTLAPQVGTQFGIAVTGAGSVTLTDLDTTDSYNRGISVLAPAGEVVIIRVHVKSPRASAGVVITARKVTIEDLDVEGSASYGVWVGKCDDVEVRRIHVQDVAQSDPLERAVWFESNRQVQIDGVEVVDTRPTPRRNIVGFSGEQTGTMRNATGPRGTGGHVEIQSYSKGIAIER
jgi:polygalacturonase